ncbi:PAS domain-containing sensor histidine kinase [Halocola ammonii]
MSSLESEIGFEAVFKYATIGIVVVDEKGEINMINPNAQEIFGYSQKELLGEKMEILLPKNLKAKHEGHRENYFLNPHARAMGIGLDLKAVRKNGQEFPVEISLGHYEIKGQKRAVAFVSDITERKKTEEALRQLNEQLELRVSERTTELSEALGREKEMNELKSRFVSTASHEFRTPLSVIMSSVSLIERYTETEQQDKRDRHVHRIKKSVRNLTDILNDFLSLEKLQQGKMVKEEKSFNLEELVNECVDEARTTAQSGQSLVYDHQGLTTVELDPKMTRNILHNLLSNAIKYSRPNSNVEVYTSVEKKKVTIEVKDHGIGIPENEQKHLFEKFFRANNTEGIQGTGLGLNIVKHYAELMNGKVTFESKPEEGTTFKVLLCQE